ncbi:MAG: terminase small subunit [Rhodanobacteraceae bacterium]
MLTPRQRLFVAEYLTDLNATQAAIRAGYSAKTAEVQGPRLLGNVRVADAIAQAMKAREKRTEITQDRVLKELARIAFFDIRRLYNADGTLKKPHELDDEAAAVLSAIEVIETGAEGGAVLAIKKAKVFDKGNALTLAMRHLGMLKDKVEHTGPNGGPLSMVTLTTSDPVEAARQYQRVMAGEG